MKDTKEKTTFLPPEDQEFLDDFRRQWNDSLSQMRPLVDISPEGIDALCRQAVSRNSLRVVHRRRTAYSIAASVALLLGVGGTLYKQLAVDQPDPLVAENVIDEPIPNDIAPLCTRPSEPVAVAHVTRPAAAPAAAPTPEAAPQDISTPLPSIEELNDLPTRITQTSVICNHECDGNLLACNVYDYVDNLNRHLS